MSNSKHGVKEEEEEEGSAAVVQAAHPAADNHDENR